MINNTREKTQKTECVQHKQSPKPGVNFWCTERGAISTSQVPLWFFVIMVKLQLMHLYVFSEVEVSERDWNQGLGYSDLIKHYRIYVAPMTMDMFRNTFLSSFMTYHRSYGKSNTTGAISESGTDWPSKALEFMGWILSFLSSVFRPLSVFLFYFIWPLYCLSFNLRCLITSLVSSNLSFFSGVTPVLNPLHSKYE